jgi:hypothetical protein
MFKIISILIELGLIAYCVYLGFLKADPSIKDLAFMLAIIYINTLINQGNIEQLQEKLIK